MPTERLSFLSLTCGDPSLETTEQLVYACEEAERTSVELGIPFSHPASGGTCDSGGQSCALWQAEPQRTEFLRWWREFGKGTEIPLVFMTYANVVFSYGKGYRRLYSPGSGNRLHKRPDSLLMCLFEEKEEFDSSACRQDTDWI